MGHSWRQRWQSLRQGLTKGVLWDLFMVYLALLNLGLILFDLTYLWLRPFYFRHLQAVTHIYDPVKGIEPEPVTESYLEQVGKLSGELDAGVPPYATAATLASLRELSAEIIDDNPFERSGMERNRIRLFVGMKSELEKEGIDGLERMKAQEIADLFWSHSAVPDRLPGRVEYFNRELRPLLEVNFLRRYGLDGKLTDHFWLIDLPFLTIFIIEFLSRWYLAVRRRTYPRWYFFPIFNWYDLLGILPIKEMRLFRLFRIAAIYIRLHKSEHSIVGDDPISRLVQYFANIISEEISDLVALRILNDTHEELREGTHKRIINAVAAAHRDEVVKQLAQQVGAMVSNPEVRRHARGFLDANLERAVDSAGALRRMPIPDFLLQPLIEIVGRSVFEAFADTLAATMTTDDGRKAVESMISDAVDGLVFELTDGELERLVKEISIEVIRHLKDTVAVRKWALPDQPKRSFLTHHLLD